MQRVFDVVLAFVALVVLSPFILLSAVIVAVSMGRPLLFRHERPGLYGEPFYLFKFRTMNDARGADGKLLPGQERLTKAGRFLRKYSLDELPQLINVLRGELSLVGPRPLLMQYLAVYTPEQMRRHDRRPGITGWAQVNGRNAISWDEKFAYDLWFVDHYSHRLYWKILFLTVKSVLYKEGVSASGHYSMEKYKGSGQ